MVRDRQTLRARRLCPTLLALAALTSCNSVPAYQRPDLQLPPDWFPTQDHQETFLREWWSGFGDANLTELVERSRTNNLDIRATVQRLLQAQAQMRVARGSLFPFLTLGGSVERVRKTRESQSGADGKDDGTSTDGDVETLYRLELAASYETDFWGRNRASVVSAAALTHATAEDVRTVSITAETETAVSYISTCAWNERLDILRNMLENANETLAILQSVPGKGVANDLEVHRQKASIAGIEVQIAAVTQQSLQEQDKLKVLL